MDFEASFHANSLVYLVCLVSYLVQVQLYWLQMRTGYRECCSFLSCLHLVITETL